VANCNFAISEYNALAKQKTMLQTNQKAIPVSAAWAIFPLGFATALSLMGDVTLYTVLPTRFADAGIALGFVGVILSINRIIRLITNNAMGWIFDRQPNRRAIFLGSLALGVITTTMYATSAELPSLLLARLLWGLAWSGIWVGGNALVLEMAPEAQRGRWVGILQMWFFLGSATASFLGGSLTDIVGYRGALWIGAGISAFGTLIALVALVTRRSDQRVTKTPLARPRDSFWSSVRAISPAMWAAVTAQGVNRLAAAGIVSGTLGLIVQQTFGTGLQLGTWQIGIASLSGVLLGSRTLISVVGAPIAGRMSDRAGGRWSLLVIALLVGALGTALLPAPNLIVLIFGTIISALAYGATQALSTALVGDLAKKEEYGKNLGIYNTSGDLGSAIGPLAAYALLPLTGLPALYVGCSIVMLAMAAWAMRFK
jgi:MFS family permease